MRIFDEVFWRTFWLASSSGFAIGFGLCYLLIRAGVLS